MRIAKVFLLLIEIWCLPHLVVLILFIFVCLLLWDEHGTLGWVRGEEKSVSILQLVQFRLKFLFPCIGFLHHVDNWFLVIDESIDLHVTHLLYLLTLTQSNRNIADFLTDLLRQFIVLKEVNGNLVLLGGILASLVPQTASSLLSRPQLILSWSQTGQPWLVFGQLMG